MIYHRMFYVIFEDIPENRWWRFDKSVNHCYLITGVTKSSCVEINQTEKGVLVKGYDVGARVYIEELLQAGKRVVCVNTDEGMFSNNLFPVKSRSCVELCKDILAIYDWKIQTPKQLYKKLTGDKYAKNKKGRE